ncbi:hypothetical protein VNI00_017389 [Paramarasmius palmivorus]|uniref:BTB domain-containing protein n=1 Tax=Paramarasmius palmivorus TaxID=297713 RepID=A0AAW0B658_9AGAR
MSATPCISNDARCPVSDCSIPIDLVIESSDGEHFGAHKKNLETFNTSFPTSSTTHAIRLSENQDVLALLLQFSHYQDHKEISGKGLDIVLDLATAADKYGNFFAGTAARDALNYMGREDPLNALRIIPYKAIHGDLREIDAMVRSTIDFQISTVLEAMKPYPDVFYTYVIYKERKEKWRINTSWMECVNIVNKIGRA